MVRKERREEHPEIPPMGEMLKSIAGSFIDRDRGISPVPSSSLSEVAKDLLPRKIVDLFVRNPREHGPSDFDPPQAGKNVVWETDKQKSPFQ